MSHLVKLLVQQDQVTSVGGLPLPEDYWTRPIHALNREWYQIAGNWLKGAHPDGNLNRYSTAPSTPHVVWTKPTTFGGIVGDFGDISYHTGSAYESFWTAGSGTIINGKLYYNEPKAPRYGWYCVDLRTGEQYFIEQHRPNTNRLTDRSTYRQHQHTLDVPQNRLWSNIQLRLRQPTWSACIHLVNIHQPCSHYLLLYNVKRICLLV